jgi:orotate phosphoribosyltransferase
MNAPHELVKTALRIGAIELLPNGRTLKIGRISPYFFNSGLFNTGRNLRILAEAYAHVITSRYMCFKEAPWSDHVLFGPAYKGIPLVAAIAICLDEKYGIEVGYAFDRKESKDHGEGGDLVGCAVRGHSVYLIDDVITSGTSIDASAKFVTEHGGFPKECVIAFDRQEQGKDGGPSAVREVKMKLDIPVVAAATLQDLIDVLTEDNGEEFPLGKQVLPKILEYRDQYGS